MFKKNWEIYLFIMEKLKKAQLNEQDVEMKINIEKRNDTRAYHSATHLLHESLRRVLGPHVTQKGSLVEPERLRFDFSHMKPISDDEMVKIESHVNDMISKTIRCNYKNNDT